MFASIVSPAVNLSSMLPRSHAMSHAIASRLLAELPVVTVAPLQWVQNAPRQGRQASTWPEILLLFVAAEIGRQADRRIDVCFANVDFLFISSFYNDFCQVVIS